MNQILDDLRYSRGSERYALRNGLWLDESFENPRILSSKDGSVLHAKSRRKFLQFANEASLDEDGFGIIHPGYHYSKDGKEFLLTLLEESHRLMIYDPQTGELLDSLYTCSPVKTAEKTFADFNNKIGIVPDWSKNLDAIVNKEMSLKEEKDIGFPSIDEFTRKTPHNLEQGAVVVAVFYDIPDRKMDEDELEFVLTKALNKEDPRPTLELVKRYEGQGYSYIHASKHFIAGGHSFTGLKSFHHSMYGKLKYVLPALKRIEKGMHSESGYVTLKLILPSDKQNLPSNILSFEELELDDVA